MRPLSSRLPYSAIVDRPPLKLPQGGRIAVWTIVNVEEWSIERAMPRTVLPPPYGQPLLPGGVLLELKFHVHLPQLFHDLLPLLPLQPARLSKYRRCIQLCGLAGG